MQAAFVPKSRRPKFEFSLYIHDLNNVPLVSGQAYVKWHLSGVALAEGRGRTDKAPIKDHKVTWDYSQKCQVHLTIDRQGWLQEQNVVLEINQEYAGARERILLGTVNLNLAEYASLSGIPQTRRYLMQDSKINSTIKVTISMKQISGDNNFQAPLLKAQQVFSGLAGIITNAHDSHLGGEPTNTTPNPSTSNIASLSTASREAGSLQDVYRTTLAASWQLQAGEMNAEDCIEDIFSGGDGWAADEVKKYGIREQRRPPSSRGGRTGGNKSDFMVGVSEGSGRGDDDELEEDESPDTVPRSYQDSFRGVRSPTLGTETGHRSGIFTFKQEKNAGNLSRTGQHHSQGLLGSIIPRSNSYGSVKSLSNLPQSTPALVNSRGIPSITSTSSPRDQLNFRRVPSSSSSGQSGKNLSSSMTALSITPSANRTYYDDESRSSLEVDETHGREDLRSWHLPSYSSSSDGGDSKRNPGRPAHRQPTV